MRIDLEAKARAPLDKVWSAWTDPEAIKEWNFATEDWCCPKSEVDLRVGGKMTSRMEAKDGSMGFDFTATFTRVDAPRALSYELDDGRAVEVTFEERDGVVLIREGFDAETENDVEMQRAGWQAILDNFVRYLERA